MRTRVYLIRHGEIKNSKQIVYARLPGFHLTEKGIEQINKTSDFLADKKISAIYTSPMYRAKQTAGIIQKKLSLPKITVSNSLTEIKTSYQGKPNSLFKKTNDNFYFPPYWKKGDETIPKILERMQRILFLIFKKNAGENIAVVSHADPILILRAGIKNLPLTIESIRPKKYLHFGEVLLIEKGESEKVDIKSIFIPK